MDIKREKNDIDDTDDINSKLISTSPMATMYMKTHNNVWVPDHAASNCAKCLTSFGYLTGKHHCRSCGNIFCASCASKYIEIPDYIRDKPTPNDIKNPSYYFKVLRSNEQRVCEQCYIMIQNKITVHEQIVRLFADPVDIESLKDQPCEVTDYYRHELRNTQYLLPDHEFSDIERKILLVNMKHLAGHSKYLSQMLKVINYEDAGQADYALSILKSPKTKKCDELYCTGTCSEELKFDDVINILYSSAKVLPDTMLEYLFGILMDVSIDLIICGCTFLTNLIVTHRHLHKYIHDLLARDITLMYRCYWQLSIMSETSTPAQVGCINAFILLIDTGTVYQMHREYLFFARLIDSLDEPSHFLVDNMKIPIHVPYNPNIMLYSAYIDEIEVKDSHTRPVIIPFESSIGKIKLIFKRESVHNDHCVLNLTKVVNIILKSVFETDFDLVTYSAMPLTASAGIIEFVSQAETLHKLTKEKRSISQFLIDENDDESAPSINKIKNTYICSLAGYTLLGYFLGLGDRHLQNVMITRRGSLFHIDFSYILGNSAFGQSITGPEIQFTCDMVSVIGGQKSKYYRKYLDYCSRGVLVLKKYFNLFYIALSQNQPIGKVKPFILERFQPRQSDSTIVKELMTIIERSHGPMPDIVRDFVHYYNRDISMSKVMATLSSALKIVGIIGLL